MTACHIRGARVFSGDGGDGEVRDLWVHEGRVRFSAPAEKKVEVIEGAGKALSPGLVDLYVGLGGLPSSASIAAEMQAAAQGGITTFCCGPDSLSMLDERAAVELLTHTADNAGGARLRPYGALTEGLKGERLPDLKALAAAGCPAFSHGDRPLPPPRMLANAMRCANDCGLAVVLQPTLADLAAGGVAHQGDMAMRLGLPTIPVAAESVAMAVAVELVCETGCRLHFSRLSSARGLEVLRHARGAGMPVTADVGIHHLFLSDEVLASLDGHFHTHPPLRSIEDREALRAAVAEGMIEAVCSGHSPCSADAKLRPFPSTTPGMRAFADLLPLMLRLGLELDWPLGKTLQLVTAGPASLLPIDMEVGHIEDGGTADLCLFDPEVPLADEGVAPDHCPVEAVFVGGVRLV